MKIKKIQNSRSVLKINELRAFTLVELIIVMTIVAILAIIAFVSFQNYTKGVRDGNRIATLKNIEKWLTLYQLKSWKYPQPENKVQILSGSMVLIQQWIIWKNIPQLIQLNKEVQDPKDSTNYIYSITGDQKKYQLWTYLEENTFMTYFLQTYASNMDYTKRYLYTLWDLVGILVDQETNTAISIENYPSGNLDITDEENKNEIFTLYFSNNSNSWSISASWSVLTEIIQINQNTTPTEINTTQSCWATLHNQKKIFWNTLSVLPGNTCPAWVEFTCSNGDWVHETLGKNDYPYASCIVWENMCTLTDDSWWIVLSDTTPSCYLLD